MSDHNLYRFFEPSFEAFGHKELLCTRDGKGYSYSAIEQRSAQLARALSALDIQAGDRVTVQVRKSPEALCLYLACIRSGLVYHPLNMAYTPSELAYFLADAEPSLVVCDPERLADFASITCTAMIYTMDAHGSGELSDLANHQDSTFGTLPRAANDTAALLYSSGTTGQPKGIMLTHGNLTSNARTLIEYWGFNEQDRLLHALPVFHVHGLFVATGCVLGSGASMRWLSRYRAEEVCRFLPECTVMMGVPTYYTRLLDQSLLDRNLTSNMRLFISGSAPLLTETFHAFEARTGHRILERYGMTETNMNTSNPLVGARKPGTVGPALPGIEVRIVDDEGSTLPPGAIGNLQVRGPNVFKGYWQRPEKTAEDFTDDGFFNTGDKAEIDSEGYVSIVGRAKDLVISGGLNVYPREVELFIDKLPGVEESAVIGLPHDDLGETVVAVIVTQPAAEQNAQHIIEACREALANFKVPKQIIFVPELPRNTMGKVQKNALRKHYARQSSKQSG